MTTENKQATPVTTPPPVTPVITKPPVAAQTQHTITSANLPPATPNSTTPSPSQVEVLLSDDAIIAKPLIDPDFTDLKPVNPNYSLRWVNRVAGGGQRFAHMKASGFRVCNFSDIKFIPDHFKKDSHIINGDLILMMIPRNDYLGALKHNQQKAHKRLRRGFAMESGQKAMKEALNEVPGSAANKQKVKLYDPGL